MRASVGGAAIEEFPEVWKVHDEQMLSVRELRQGLGCTPQGGAVCQWDTHTHTVETRRGACLHYGECENLSGSRVQELVFSCGFEVEAVDPSSHRRPCRMGAGIWLLAVCLVASWSHSRRPTDAVVGRWRNVGGWSLFAIAWAVSSSHLCSFSFSHWRGPAIRPKSGPSCWVVLIRLRSTLAPLLAHWCAAGKVPKCANLDFLRRKEAQVPWHCDDEAQLGNSGAESSSFL